MKSAVDILGYICIFLTFIDSLVMARMIYLDAAILTEWRKNLEMHKSMGHDIVSGVDNQEMSPIEDVEHVYEEEKEERANMLDINDK